MRHLLSVCLPVMFAVASLSADPEQLTVIRDDSPREYDLKAAFLLNFVRFVEWPASAFAGASAPIQLCLFAYDPFGDTLDRVLKGETVADRPLTSKRIRRAAESDGCHLTFVPASWERRAAALLRVTAPMLTVGESRRFLDIGGAVSLLVEDGRVRFDVNLPAVERRDIRIRARMLKLAREVRQAKPAK